MTDNKTFGAVLAGGHSSRFQDGHKAVALLHGQTLISHAVLRLKRQVAEVVINQPPNFPLANIATDIHSYQRVEDEITRRDGPLIGVLSCMRLAKEKGYEWLQICPCDSPFLPLDLVARNLSVASGDHSELIIPKSTSGRQPSLSLWSTALLATLETAVLEKNKSGYKQFFDEAQIGFSQWNEHEEDYFFNINTVDELETAQGMINNSL